MESQNQDNKNQNTLSTKNSSVASFFNDQNDFSFVLKKTEKLASALYLITNLFSDNEPMKWTLRKKVSELMSFMVSYKDIRQSELPSFINTAKTKVLEIVSLLEVASLGGLVSNMNFSIIDQEFSNLILALNNTQKTDSSNTILPIKFFNFDKPEYPRFQPQNNHEIRDALTSRESSVFKSNNRQNIILGLLKKKRELTIKDIASIIKDVSEKTIQRELISLISAGVLVKTGERRWSKYSLNIAK